jgi:hypothetical protein
MDQCISKVKCSSSLGKYTFQIILQSEQFYIHFYISLQPIIEKVLRRITTLCLETFWLELICKNYDHIKLL